MIKLPEGWEVEHLGGDEPKRFVVLHAPNKRGMVTIDYKQRVFRGGWSTIGLSYSNRTGTFFGKGWKAELESEAVRWLSWAIEC